MTTESKKNDFAHKLDLYLKFRRLTRSEFAAILGIKACAVSHWCTGARMPSRKHFKKIMSASKGYFTKEDYLC